jgi:hypothetical protein
LEDTKRVVRSRISEKDRQYNGQKDKQWSWKYCKENQRSSNIKPTKNPNKNNSHALEG